MSIKSKLLPAARVPGDALNEGGMAVPSALADCVSISPLPLLLCDPQGRVLLANEALRAALGGRLESLAALPPDLAELIGWPARMPARGESRRREGWVPLEEAALMRAIELNGVSIDFNKQAFNWGRLAAHDLAAVKRLATPAQVVEIKRQPNLNEVIEKRIAFLTDYQNADYAMSYKAFVDQVKAAEEKVVAGAPLRLTEAVAKYLFKLMAYKDEYEVARLYTDGRFQKKIADMFEGDYQVHFHLAPPMFAKKDAKGHLVKEHYGPWMMKAFGLLAKMKFLRGTAIDPFGRTEERRTERRLPVEYRETISRLLSSLNADNLAKAVAIASIPEDIRGYGHVKERYLASAKQKEAALLAEFQTREVKRSAA